MILSHYSVGPQDEVIGFSVWPWDPYYRPTVGVFLNGALVAHAFCELARPQDLPETRIAPNGLQKFLRSRNAERTEPHPLQLKGPDSRAWFRLSVGADLLARIRAGDPAVRLARLEDGEELGRLGPADRAPRDPVSGRGEGAPISVEGLLELRSAEAGGLRLDGFPVFRQTALKHQLDLVYFDVLRRLPDPAGRKGYLGALQAGHMTFFDMRRDLMGSEEFRRRRIGVHDRLGRFFVSSVWHALRSWPTLEQAAARAGAFRLERNDELTTPDFVQRVFEDAFGRAPSSAATRHFVSLAEILGRGEVAELIRSAGDTSQTLETGPASREVHRT